ncbi:MAG: hypothetical protein ACO1OG_11025 [Devosia sp.]
MHLPLKTTASLVLVALLAAPAFAAADSAMVVNAVKADAVPITILTPMIGQWSNTDLNLLDKAASIKVFDTKMLYGAGDLQKIASAETEHSYALGQFRNAILADGDLAAWFKANNIDVNRVVAFSDPSGSPQVFLY